jgi:hypothetical protein
LRVLLDRHPELRAEAESIGTTAITDARSDAIADEIEEAILGLGLDDRPAKSRGAKSA